MVGSAWATTKKRGASGGGGRGEETESETNLYCCQVGPRSNRLTELVAIVRLYS